MKISARTITALGRIVTGDEGLSPYRSGPALVRLFNDYGADDVYGQGFPSRWNYAEQKLRGLNDAPTLAALIRQVLDPREFLDRKFDLAKALDYLNARLKYDGFEVVIEKELPKVRDLKVAAVACRHPFEGSSEDGRAFIDEQIQKSEDKIRDGDFDGAITNARSLLEAVLVHIEREIDVNAPDYDGDLTKLYRRVQRVLNLEPGKEDLETSLKQVLSGLTSIVNGIAGLSNRMGDRHVRSYKPSKHHAVLVVNAAKTMVSFLFDTQRFQMTRTKPASTAALA
jgi:hypothetical protein